VTDKQSVKRNKDGEQVRAAIISLCRERFRTAKEIAEGLGMPLNSVRAYYVYRMVREGQLEAKQVGAAERGGGARGWTRIYRVRKSSR